MSYEAANSSITLYLARHGETFGNVERVVKDPATDCLTPAGKCQALQLGNHLSDVKFTRIYCSNLRRAVQTVEYAKERLQNASETVIFDPRIKEIEDKQFIEQGYNMKIWGKGLDANHPFYDYLEFHAEGCEPVDEVFARQDSFFDDLFAQLDVNENPETVLVLSHGRLISFIMKYFMLSDKYELLNFDQDDEESTSPMKGLRNCSYHKCLISKRSTEDAETKSNSRIVKFLEIHQTDHLQDT